jgi:hypothetical protein
MRPGPQRWNGRQSCGGDRVQHQRPRVRQASMLRSILTRVRMSGGDDGIRSLIDVRRIVLQQHTFSEQEVHKSNTHSALGQVLLLESRYQDYPSTSSGRLVDRPTGVCTPHVVSKCQSGFAQDRFAFWLDPAIQLSFSLKMRIRIRTSYFGREVI